MHERIYRKKYIQIHSHHFWHDSWHNLVFYVAILYLFHSWYQVHRFVFNVVLKCWKSRSNLLYPTSTLRLSIFNLSWIIYLSHLYIYGQSKNEELCFITIIFSSPSAFPSSIGKSKCCFPFTTQKSLLVRVAIKHCINCIEIESSASSCLKYYYFLYCNSFYHI